MASKALSKRLLFILVPGVVLCAAAYGIRVLKRPPITGKWLGVMHSTLKNGAPGSPVDPPSGYALYLSPDGTYVENGTMTEGTWEQKGGAIKLQPRRLMEMSKDDFLKAWGKKVIPPSKQRLDWLDRVFSPTNLSIQRNGHELWAAEENVLYIFRPAS